MDEKRCEWCGTLSPADAVKCTLCRIPFGAPVPPPQDWSHLTGNIPVITAPLLETPAPPAVTVPAPSPAPDEVVAPVPVRVAAEVSAPAPTTTEVPSGAETPAVAAPAALVQPASPTLPTQRVAAEAVLTAVALAAPDDAALPGWRAPDDPTLRVFADKLEERELRRRNAARSSARRGRSRRRLIRLLVWLVGIGLITAFLLLAPAHLPGF